MSTEQERCTQLTIFLILSCLINTVNVNQRRSSYFSLNTFGNLSYRQFGKNICIEDDCEGRFTQTNMLLIHERLSMQHLDRVQGDLEDFKRYTHGKIVSMKVDVANRQTAPSHIQLPMLTKTVKPL